MVSFKDRGLALALATEGTQEHINIFFDRSARLCRFYKGDSRLKEEKNIFMVNMLLCLFIMLLCL